MYFILAPDSNKRTAWVCRNECISNLGKFAFLSMRENALNNVDFGKNFPSTLEKTKSNSCSYASCKTSLLAFCHFYVPAVHPLTI